MDAREIAVAPHVERSYCLDNNDSDELRRVPPRCFVQESLKDNRAPGNTHSAVMLILYKLPRLLLSPPITFLCLVDSFPLLSSEAEPFFSSFSSIPVFPSLC